MEAVNGEGVLDDFVRNDNGCKNGGEKNRSLLDFCSRLSDELRCRSEETKYGWGSKYW